MEGTKFTALTDRFL